MTITRSILPIIMLSLALGAQMPTRAAETTETNGAVEEIVVSSRIPLAERRIATSVSVLSGEEIEARGNQALVDVLRQLPAIGVSSTGPGRTSALRIRGEEGFRTLTLFDGIRLLDTGAPQIMPSMEQVLSSGVARVEVLRGPQGLSYGADAGGVIRLSSPRADEAFFATLDAQGGDLGSRQFSANAGGEAGPADYFIGLADYRTQGFNSRGSDALLQDDDGYRNRTLHGRGGIAISETWRMDLVHRRVDGQSEYDGCFDPATFASVHACQEDYRLEASRAGLEFAGDAYSHELSFASSRTERENFSRGLPAFSTAGKLERLEYLGSATALPGFDLVFGVDWEEAAYGGEGRNNLGYYLEYVSDFSDRLFLSAGLRRDHNEDFGRNNSHRVSAAWLMEAGQGELKLKASHGSGFRAPSPYEIAYNRRPGVYFPAAEARLAQESSQGYELGLEYYGAGRTRLEAVYFHQKVEDAIYFDLASFSGYLQSEGDSRSRGLEMAAEIPLADSAMLSANYTYNDTERPGGEQRPRRPQHLANLGLRWSGMAGRLKLNAFVRLSRDAIDEVGGRSLPLDDFEVLDLSASYRLSSQVEVFGRLENALDEDYQEITDYNTAGRAAFLGFRLSFASL